MISPLAKVHSRPGFVRLQIDVTNKCGNQCIYCTRFPRHLRPDRIFEMDPGLLEYILDCSIELLDGPMSMFGIIGGEPLLHSKFSQLCKLIRSRKRYGQFALFTSIDPMKSQYRSDVLATFHYIPANLHTFDQLQTCLHHPFTLSPVDMVENPLLRRELIENCWIGDNWCFSASPYGIFHCEVAYGLAVLQGKKGWKIEPGWWKRPSMSDQLCLCDLCGGCIPMERQLLCDPVEKMSTSFLAMLINHNCPIGEHKLISEPYSLEYMAEWAKTWRPSQYRAEDDAEAERQGAHLGNRVDWTKDWSKWPEEQEPTPKKKRGKNL